MEFIRNNARLLGMLVIAILSTVFGVFTPEPGESFLTNFFEDGGFFLGALLTVGVGYIGERRLVGIEPNTTLTAASAILTVLLPVLAPTVDWTSLLTVIQSFSVNGVLTFGAVFGVLLNYFADIRIGRPAPEGPESDAFHSTNAYGVYKLRHFPVILLQGRRAA